MRALARAPSARRRASASLVRTRRTAAASSAGSPAGIRSAPSSPVRSGTPPVRVATMGRAAHSASCRTRGWPSHRLGSTNRSAAASRAAMSSRWPRNRTASPSGAAAAISSACNGPEPAMASSGTGLRSPQRRAASISVAKPFCGARRPAARMRGRRLGSAEPPARAVPPSARPALPSARAVPPSARPALPSARAVPPAARPGAPSSWPRPSSLRTVSPATAVPSPAWPRDGTSARPTSRAPARRIRSSRSADTHRMAVALRTTISSRAW
jgi:hypothetical protein